MVARIGKKKSPFPLSIRRARFRLRLRAAAPAAAHFAQRERDIAPRADAYTGACAGTLAPTPVGCDASAGKAAGDGDDAGAGTGADAAAPAHTPDRCAIIARALRHARFHPARNGDG